MGDNGMKSLFLLNGHSLQCSLPDGLSTLSVNIKHWVDFLLLWNGTVRLAFFDSYSTDRCYRALENTGSLRLTAVRARQMEFDYRHTDLNAALHLSENDGSNRCPSSQ